MSFIKKLIRFFVFFIKGMIKNPFTTWRRVWTKLEIHTGIPTHYISPTRLYIRHFENKILTPLPREKTKHYGNYVLHKDIALDKNSVVYSAGVGVNISFDLSLNQDTGAPIFMIDPTPRSKAYVESLDLSDDFILHPIALYNVDDEISFYPDFKENDLNNAHSFSIHNRSNTSKKITVPCHKLSTVMKQNGHTHLDVLKMDIEGVADIVLKDALKDGIRPKQIVCEFEIPANPFKAISYTKELEELFLMMKHSGYDIYSITRDILGARIEFIALYNPQS